MVGLAGFGGPLPPGYVVVVIEENCGFVVLFGLMMCFSRFEYCWRQRFLDYQS